MITINFTAIFIFCLNCFVTAGITGVVVWVVCDALGDFYGKPVLTEISNRARGILAVLLLCFLVFGALWLIVLVWTTKWVR